MDDDHGPIIETTWLRVGQMAPVRVAKPRWRLLSDEATGGDRWEAEEPAHGSPFVSHLSHLSSSFRRQECEAMLQFRPINQAEQATDESSLPQTQSSMILS